jgi:hypothetical protein
VLQILRILLDESSRLCHLRHSYIGRRAAVL